MARRRTLPDISGFCRSAQDVETGELSSSSSAESFHGRCHGGAARPDQPVTTMVNGKPVTSIQPAPPWRCECPCHEGKEIVITKAESTAHLRVAKLVEEGGGGRNKKLRESIALELQRSRGIELPKTGDDYEDRKLACRIHSAAGSVALKVRVSLKGETIVATVKE